MVLKTFLIALIICIASSKIEAQSYIQGNPPSATIYFNKKSKMLPPASKTILDSIAAYAVTHPEPDISFCCSAGNASKRSAQLAWERLNAVILYLIKKGVKKDKCIFTYCDEEPMIVYIGFKFPLGQRRCRCHTHNQSRLNAIVYKPDGHSISSSSFSSDHLLHQTCDLPGPFRIFQRRVM